MAERKPTNEQVREALDKVSNALQVAAPLSTALRRGLGDATDNALKLEAAIDRAVQAIRVLQPGREQGR